MRRRCDTAVACAALAALVVGCGGRPDPAGKPPKPAPLVALVTVQPADLSVDLQAQGHLASLNNVAVRPQLSARVAKVHFREGDQVAAGQLLFTLDAADLAAQRDRALWQKAQVVAEFGSAQRDYQRAESLVAANFASPSSLDSARSRLDSLRAQQRGAAAAVAAADAALDHARIVAPIAARTGAIGVQAGGLAQPGAAEPLVTLMQLDPIGVEFSIPEQLLPQLLTGQADKPATVTLETVDGQRAEGSLTFIDSRIDRTSGTISLKARVANRDQRLWPGTFARVTVHAGTSRQAATLPPQAIQEGPRGPFVYLLDGADRIRRAPVALLRIQDGRAIVSGLQAGQRVVTEGTPGQLRDGAAVRIAAGPTRARR